MIFFTSLGRALLIISLLMFLSSCTEADLFFQDLNGKGPGVDAEAPLKEVQNLNLSQQDMASYNKSPIITWDPPLNFPEDQISHYSLYIEDDEGQVIQSWSNVGKTRSYQLSSFAKIFDDNKKYYPKVRAVSVKQTIGPASAGIYWLVNMGLIPGYPTTTIADNPSPSIDGVCPDPCSMREAIMEAVNNNTEETVNLGPGVFEITNNTISMNKSVTIEGDGSGETLINANQLRAFNIDGTNEVHIVFKDLTIMNAKKSFGGAVNITNSNPLSTFTFDNVNFIANETSGDDGAAIHSHSYGVIYIKNSLFAFNLIPSSGSFGGIISQHTGSGDIEIENSIFVGNQNHNNCDPNCNGGVINKTKDGDLTISNSSFIQNYHAGKGLIYTANAGNTHIYNSTFYSNLAAELGGVILYKNTGTNNFAFNTLVQNTSVGGSAAIELDSGSSLNLTSNVFKDNIQAPGLAPVLLSCNLAGSATTQGNVSSDHTCSDGSGDINSSGNIYLDVGVQSNGRDFTSKLLKPITLDGFANSDHIGNGFCLSSGGTAYPLDALGQPRTASCDAGAVVYQDPNMKPRYLEYDRSWYKAALGEPIPSITPRGSGGAVDLYWAYPSLPPGITLNPSTGEISGTPVSLSPSPVTYTITAQNAFGQTSVDITLSVVDALVVTSTLDEGDETPGDDLCSSDISGVCTLRAAIEEIQANSQRDSLYLRPGYYVISNTNGNLPYLDFNLNIIGADKSTTSIQSLATETVFTVNSVSTNHYHVHLSDFTIKDSNQGAILIKKHADVKMSHIKFYNNTNSVEGGALRVPLTGYDHNVEIEFSEFTGNSSGSHGGAIYINSDGDLFSIKNSTLKNNSAFAGTGKGGAIYAKKLNIKNSLFESNSAHLGGAIYKYNTLGMTVKLSSFYNNNSNTGGGAIYSDGNGLNLSHNTFSQNSTSTASRGGAIEVSSSNLVRLSNNLFSENESASSLYNCYAGAPNVSFVGEGGDLADDSTCGTGVTNRTPTIGFVNYNGVPQMASHPSWPNFIAIQPGGEAVSAGSNAECRRKDANGQMSITSSASVCEPGVQQIN